MKINKYKQAAASIAFLTILLSTGVYPFGLGEARFFVSRSSRSLAASRQERVLEAFESGDYHRWKSLIGPRSQVGRAVSEEEFRLFVEARALVRAGRYEESLSLSASLTDQLKEKLS